MARGAGRPRRATSPAGGWRLPIDPAPALSLAGLLIIGIVSFGLLGGNLPALPGGNGNNGGPIRTPTPSGVIIVPPGHDVPGAFLYVKDGNIWIQSGDGARQLTDSGRDRNDAMPVWSPDGAWVYFVHTQPEVGTWLSAGELREYNLQIPSLRRIAPDGTGDSEILLTGRVKSGSNLWSYFIREPSISPDGKRAAIITDGPDPTIQDPVVKFVELGTRTLIDPGLPEVQLLGHASPAWSPDGRFVLYVRNARDGTRGTPEIRRFNLTNEQDRALTGAGYRTPAWSRDGRYVAVTKTSSFGTDIVILDQRNGAELRRLTNDEQSFNPVWSPMMDAIAFFKVQHGVVDLWVVPLLGTAPNWDLGEAFPITVSAGLDAASRPSWFIPADQLPPASSDPGASLAP